MQQKWRHRCMQVTRLCSSIACHQITCAQVVQSRQGNMACKTPKSWWRCAPREQQTWHTKHPSSCLCLDGRIMRSPTVPARLCQWSCRPWKNGPAWPTQRLRPSHVVVLRDMHGHTTTNGLAAWTEIRTPTGRQGSQHRRVCPSEGAATWRNAAVQQRC